MSVRFFILMLMSSGLGFLKVAALAMILAPGSFGQYATIVGIAALSSTLLSFGLVEGTIKVYPRLWMQGDMPELRRNSRHITAHLTLRFILAASAIAAVAAFVDIGYAPETVLISGLLGLGTGLLALLASLIRATTSAPLLQRFSMMRSMIALTLACGGAWLWAWQGAVMGEAVAALISLTGGWRAMQSHFVEGLQARAPDAPVAADSSGGGKLYVATLFSSSISLSDRAFVNAALGPAIAGAYSLIALLFQIGQLVANIVAQRFGPVIIKAVHAGERSGTGLRAMWRPALALFVLAVSITAAMLVMTMLDIRIGRLQDYDLSPTTILLGGLISFFQIYALLEFLLIARDREGAVLSASATGAAFFFGLFGLAAYLRLELVWFLAAALLARVAQTIVLVIVIYRSAERE